MTSRRGLDATSHASTDLATTLLTGLAAGLAVAAGAIVFVFHVGPVIWVISSRQRHGIHLGDLLIGVPLGVLAVVIAALALLLNGRSAPTD